MSTNASIDFQATQQSLGPTNGNIIVPIMIKPTSSADELTLTEDVSALPCSIIVKANDS